MSKASKEPRRSLPAVAPARLFRCLLVSLLLTAAAVAPPRALASVPEGPRLAASVFRVHPNAGTEVRTLGPFGEAPLRLAGGPDNSVPGPQTKSRPSWSPDGSLLAFTGSAGGTAGIYVVRADGSHLRLLRSSRRVLFQGDPVFTPDGRTLAVTAIQVVRGQFNRPAPRDPSEQQLDVRFAIWAITVDGSPPRPLTPWQRRALLEPAAFSAEGKTLVAGAYDGRSTKAVAIRVGDGLFRGMRVLARDATEPGALAGRLATCLRSPPLYVAGKRLDPQLCSAHDSVLRRQAGRTRQDPWRAALAQLGSLWAAPLLHSAQRLRSRVRCGTSSGQRGHAGQRGRLVPHPRLLDQTRFHLWDVLAARSRSRGRSDQLLTAWLTVSARRRCSSRLA